MLVKTTQMMAPTLRDVPAEAEVVSHQLMLRAGMIRKSAAGIYTYLPLAYRVLRKTEEIVRQEMDRAGAQEVMLPIVQPSELWKETGRWDVYGEEMFRLKDRHGREFCLGPTHEEIITALVRSEVRSYKELPLLLYQMQNKYRDEIRPRFGLLRGREFVMKDMYSFDRDLKGMKDSYQKIYEAYDTVFSRIGLNFRAVEADAGAIGGNTSHEFMALADSGEASIAYCQRCDYVANVEKAEAVSALEAVNEGAKEKELVYTPGAKTIQSLAEFLQTSPKKLLKTLFYVADGSLIAVLLRGDRELNTIKLKNFLDSKDLHMALPEEVAQRVGAIVGYLGPLGLVEQGVRVFADQEVAGMVNFAVGANREGCHYINVNLGRDFSVAEFIDLRDVAEGDLCPRCGSSIQLVRGIEVGQVFQLGTKYSEALGATYTDVDGSEKKFVMGCYGIGVSRTVAAIIEQSHDELGIIWPMAVAPYHVVVVPVTTKDETLMQKAVDLATCLVDVGVETVLDDRDERAGVKFTDADLIGYPLRITVGKKTINEGTVDLKIRRTGKEQTVSLVEIIDIVKELVEAGLKPEE